MHILYFSLMGENMAGRESGVACRGWMKGVLQIMFSIGKN